MSDEQSQIPAPTPDDDVVEHQERIEYVIKEYLEAHAPAGPADLARGRYSLNAAATPVVADTYTKLAFGAIGGADVLDLTDPTQPTVKEAGIYAVSGLILGAQDPTTVGRQAIGVFSLDDSGVGAETVGSTVMAANGAFGWRIPLANTYYIPEDGVIVALAAHHDTTAKVITGEVYVQRLA